MPSVRLIDSIIMIISFILVFPVYVAYVLISGLASRCRDSSPNIGSRISGLVSVMWPNIKHRQGVTSNCPISKIPG